MLASTISRAVDMFSPHQINPEKEIDYLPLLLATTANANNIYCQSAEDYKRKKNIKTTCVVKKVNPTQSDVQHNSTKVGRTNNFKPFTSQGLVSFIRNENRAVPISILRDTGVANFFC